jgi:hypothetical protein
VGRSQLHVLQLVGYDGRHRARGDRTTDVPKNVRASSGDEHY